MQCNGNTPVLGTGITVQIRHFRLWYTILLYTTRYTLKNISRKGLIIVKFYSEKTKRLYDTEADLREAERKLQDAKKELEKAEAIRRSKEKAEKEKRNTREKEIEISLKEAYNASSKTIQLLDDFIKDYGYLPASYSFPVSPITAKANTTNTVKDNFMADNFIKEIISFLEKG